MLADGRDQIFQSDPFASYPSGLHVFEEDNRMTMGRCPYNGKWGRDRYGDAYLESVKDRNILCVGTVIGDLPEVRNLVRKMHIEIGNHPRYGGLEQAVFQYLILTGKVEAEVHSNEESDVYTVGYIPRETVRADERGVIYNLAGSAPAAIHQYDRHENLKKVVASRWPYPSTK